VSERSDEAAKQTAIIATASVDSSVKVWIRHENEGIACCLFNIASRT
jgi:hypothetical protein